MVCTSHEYTVILYLKIVATRSCSTSCRLTKTWLSNTVLLLSFREHNKLRATNFMFFWLYQLPALNKLSVCTHDCNFVHDKCRCRKLSCVFFLKVIFQLSSSCMCYWFCVDWTWWRLSLCTVWGCSESNSKHQFAYGR